MLCCLPTTCRTKNVPVDKCNCRISRTRIPVSKGFETVDRSVAVFFGRIFNRWSTHVGCERGRLADLSSKISGGVRWVRCSANISVLIRVEADHHAQRDFHSTTGGVSTEIPTLSPQHSPWFTSKQVGQLTLWARHSKKKSLCEQNPSAFAHSRCFYVQQYSIDC